MKKTIYKYFFHEFIRYFAIVLFAFSAVIWTIQAVNFLDLVTEDGHAFRVYIHYSFLTIPKILTKLTPFSFLIAAVLTILKFEKDNELIILWSSGLNKIHVANLLFKISLLVMIFQIFMANIINPISLNSSRSVLKNSELQFVPSLLKEKNFNDTLKGLTIFVDNKNSSGEYENIFIRDDKNILTKVSSNSSTIFAKSGYLKEDEKKLILLDGNIQRLKENGSISVVKFKRTEINLGGISTKSISEPKIQETSTIQIIKCLQRKNVNMHNCEDTVKGRKDIKIEINKRFGVPIFIPLIALICCFLLSSLREKKFSSWKNYFYFFICFSILIISEVTVRYSGNSINHTFIYYLLPVVLSILVYLFLIKNFKYENLN